METLQMKDVRDALLVVSETVMDNQKYFCDLDAVAGDGDFGSTLAKGFKKIKEELSETVPEDLGVLHRKIGMIIMEKCGGATGSLWGTAFRAVAKVVKGKTEVTAADIGRMMHAFIEGMQKAGGAQPGDKTLLDALFPAAESIDRDITTGEKDIAVILKRAGEAASTGAEKTKDMVARKGRATYLGKRSLGHPDAGAEAISVIIKELNGQFFTAAYNV
jgi:phosphoenolpyruvate---glycerone phosphotransferase subunit DhaL